jgi:hypothetical protein
VVTVAPTPRLLVGLVDDAGLFPPERLPMAAALDRHRADAAAGHPVLTHRFLCPASRLDELTAMLGPNEQLRTGIVVDTGLDRLQGLDPRLVVETVEVPLPQSQPAEGVAAVAAARVPAGGRIFGEVPRVDGWRDAVLALADAGLDAKVRCGGMQADLFPTADELAAFIDACAGRSLPFKATAGLHHAVRYRDPATGFEHHGFLNLVVAVGRAVDGGEPDDLAGALRIDDGEALAGEAAAMPADTAEQARRLLVAYGSCSTSEPLDDLAALGLLRR